MSNGRWEEQENMKLLELTRATHMIAGWRESGHHRWHLLASLEKLKQCRYKADSLFYLLRILIVIAVLGLCNFTHIDSYAWHRPKISESESKKRCQRRPDTNLIWFNSVTSFLLIPLHLVSWSWLKSCHIDFLNPTCQSALQDWVRRARKELFVYSHFVIRRS